MATTFNLGNIKGDQGFQGRETIVIFRPVTIGDAVPTVPTGGSVAADGTITAPTDWFNPADLVFDATTQDLYSTVITWNPATDPAPYTFLTWDVVIRDNGRAGADSTAPTIQIDEQPAGAAGSDPVFVEAAGSTDQARVYDITLSTGATGERGPTGPAGSASIFETDTVTTIGESWTQVLIGAANFNAYIATSTDGLMKFYPSDTTVNTGLVDFGSDTWVTDASCSIFMSRNDNQGNDQSTLIDDGVTPIVLPIVATPGITITIGARTIVTAAADYPAGFTPVTGALLRCAVTVAGTWVGAQQEIGVATVTTPVAVAGQTFAQGAFTIDNQTDPASLYIKRSIGSVTTAADNASLPDVNTVDFQPITLP